MNPNNTFFPEQLFSSWKAWFRRNQAPFFASLIFGLLAHGFALTNKLAGNDELRHLFLKGTTIESGRWGLELTPLIFPDFSMPWIYGLISIVLVAFAVCLMVDMLCIRSKALQILLGGLIVTFPTLTATLIYMFTSSSYALSFFLSVLAAYWFQKGGMGRLLGGVVCLAFAMGIYQAYVSVAASLLVLVLIRQVLAQETCVKQIFRSGVSFVILLGFSAVLYYGILQLIFLISGQGFGGYAGMALSGGGSLLQKLFRVYKTFCSIFLTNYNGLILTPFSHILHLICLLVGLVEIVLWLRCPKEKGSGLLLLFLGAILPFAVNFIYMIADPNSVHTLMLYSTVSIYLLAALVLELRMPAISGKLRAAAINLVPLCMALIILVNTYIGNEVTLKLHLMYENSYSLCTSLSTQFRQTPGYTEQTPVVITGQHDPLPFYDKFPHLEQLVGHRTMFLVPLNYPNMFRFYLGTQMNLVEDTQIIDAITATAEYAQMPCYPDYGSIQMIEDVLVVKFS